MNDPFESPDAKAALSYLNELDTPLMELDLRTPHTTAESLDAIFELLLGFDVLTRPSTTSLNEDIARIFDISESDAKHVIQQLKVLAPYMPDEYVVSAKAKQWADGTVEKSTADTIAGVLYATNRWNVAVPGINVEFPRGCICCVDTRADPVPITSSRTATFDASDNLSIHKTASVSNAYEVCDFCSRHFDKYRGRQMLDKGLPIVTGIAALLGIVAAAIWFFDSPRSLVHTVFGWTGVVFLATALLLYLLGRRMHDKWNREGSGLKPTCRSATCPIEIELKTSPLRWKTEATFEDAMKTPDGITEKVAGTDIDADTKLYIWISGFADMEQYARDISALNRDADVVRALVE